MRYIVVYRTFLQPLQVSAWIGLKRGTGTKHDVFQWQRNKTVIPKYQPWCISEPNNGFGGENCTEMAKGYGCLNDLNCEKLRPYICERGKDRRKKLQ